MKRVLYWAAALLVLSCAREVLPEPAQPEEKPEIGTYKVSLTATFDPETRLEVSPTAGTMTWESTDEIAVFTRENRLRKGVVESVDGARATFTFNIDNDDAIEAGASAYYPYSIAVEGHSDQINLPGSFTDLGAANRSIPMKAVVTEGSLALPFKHLASLVYVNAPTSTPSYPGDGGAPSNTPQYVVFSVGEGSQPIAGTFTVATDGTLTPAGDNGTSIQTPWVSGQPYLFALPPATYANGFSLSITSAPYTVSATEQTVFTFYRKKRSSSYTAERANLLNMPAFNPQCKEFYLTSTATEWSDSEPLARMIQTGENSFLGALYSYKGPKAEWDLGLRILQGYNLGTHWHNTIGGIAGTEIASYGKDVGNFNRFDDQFGGVGVYQVSITLYDNNWRYTLNRVGDEYHHDHLYLVGGFDNWSAEGIVLTQKVGHNWYAQVEVGADKDIKPGETYGWKIYNGDWYVQWNDGSITPSKLSSYVNFNNEYQPNGSLQLNAGTYDIYFNDAVGWIQFVKK